MSYQRKEVIGGHSVAFIGDVPRVAIYCLRECVGLPPVYVGSTSQALKHRVRAHLLDSKRGSDLPIHEWLRSQQSFVVEVLEVVDASDRTERERHWIASFSGLLNMTDGGPGMSGHRFAGTPHAKRIGEKIRTSKKYICETCAGEFHRKHSQAVKGNCRFCSRTCFSASLVGVSKPVSRKCVARGVAAAAAARRSRPLCKRGHPLGGENLFLTSAGSRGCKECRKLHKATYLGRSNDQVA